MSKPATKEEKKSNAARECGGLKQDRKFSLRKIFSIDVGEYNDMEYDAFIDGHAAVAKLNSGASHTFMSPKTAINCALSVVSAEQE